MDNDTKLKMIEALGQGGMSVGQLIIENTGSITYNDHRSPAREADAAKGVSKEAMGRAIRAVQGLFWGQSSYAVVFCVCRDYYGYPDNMSLFEREFDCAPGTISGTFRNNDYMKLPVSRWRDNGAKERVLVLAEAYQKAVSDACQE